MKGTGFHIVVDGVDTRVPASRYAHLRMECLGNGIRFREERGLLHRRLCIDPGDLEEAMGRGVLLEI